MRKPAILFVDDEINVLKSLNRLLWNEDYEIVTESDVEKALERLKNRTFQIVVSDYRMPKMNGLMFLKKVRKISPDSLRIILTGHADIDITLRAINEGHVYKFLTKPWDSQSLIMQIKDAVEFQNVLQERNALEEALVEKNKELTDINENLERLVEERTQQLLQAEKMATLGQMASQIGHEMRNALQIFKGNFQMACQYRSNDERFQKYTIRCTQSFDRLEIYSRNLLTLGKPKPSNLCKFNIIEAINKTIDKLNEINILKYYDISRNYNFSSQEIYGDPVQIDQMITNLLINAHHAMQQSGELSIGVQCGDARDFVDISIQDTGSGIAEENLDKVFEPFFTTKPEGKGTGLGLAVIKKIVDNHHGKIMIRSKVNQGTTVTVSLPLSDISRNQTILEQAK